MGVLAFLLLGSCGGAVSFLPANDIMTYGQDGELKTVWGEHSYYTDTSSFGPVLRVVDGVAEIGGLSGETSYYSFGMVGVPDVAGISSDDSSRALDADGWP